MTDYEDDPQASPGTEALASTTSPLVFISHDARDGELADAFSKLLKSVSAGMIKTFHSSDRKGTEGIDFGEEWYKRLMSTLQTTSDVVCLFTERSVDRPWILFEAGVAKGKLNVPVVGVALGVPLSRISVGPFYQFKNMDDSESDLTKLVNQLAKRVSGLELDPDVVQSQVAVFKKLESEILKKLGGPVGAKGGGEIAEDPIAKIMEEVKSLPSRVAERLIDSDEPFMRRRRRRIHPMIFEEISHMVGDPGDPVAILMAASLVKDDAPWLYELAMEAYRAAKSGDGKLVQREVKRISRISDVMMRGPFLEEFSLDKDSYIISREFPRMLRHILMSLPPPPDKPVARRRGNRPMNSADTDS